MKKKSAGKRVKRLGNKTFTLIGQGVEARVYRVKGASSPGKGSVIRLLRPKFKSRSNRKQFLSLHKQQFLANRMAHLLFPKNTIRMTEFDERKVRTRSAFSKPDKALDEIFEALEAANRERKKGKSYALSKDLAMDLKRLRKEVDKRQPGRNRVVREKIALLEKAGFLVNGEALNISLRDPKEPVFFELEGVYPDRVKAFLEAQKVSRSKSARVRKLLAEFEAVKPSRRWV